MAKLPFLKKLLARHRSQQVPPAVQARALAFLALAAQAGCRGNSRHARLPSKQSANIGTLRRDNAQSMDSTRRHASKRKKLAACVPKRSPTSTRKRRTRLSSGYVWSRLGVPPWSRVAKSSGGRDDGGIDRRLHPCQNGSPLVVVFDRNVQVHVSQAHMADYVGGNILADVCHRTLERTRARGQNPERGTGRAVVAMLVAARAAPACTRRKLQGQAPTARGKRGTGSTGCRPPGLSATP